MKKWLLLVRLIVLVLLALTAAVLSGCGILGLDSSGSSGDNPPDPCSNLRAPDVSMAPDPVFTADEQPRQNEVCQRVGQAYKELGYQVVFTSRGPSGTTYDWATASTVQGSGAEPPPTPTPEQIQAMLPEGVQLALTEIDVFPQLQGPAGTIPFVRDTYSAYVAGDTGAISLGDWIQNYQVVGAPPSKKAQYRMYAGIVTFAPNLGANVWINSYPGFIEKDTLSLLEIVVGCRDPNNPIGGEMRQLIGIAASRDNINLKGKFFKNDPDSVLRLQVEFLTEGFGVTGDKKGGWDGIRSGFLPPDFRPYPPGTPFATSTISTVGGPQFESLYQIALKDGDWWVGHNGHWLGRYPHALFDNATPVNDASPSNLIASQACEVDWYGEIAAFTNAPWTTTDMGSGHFASEGWQNAANFRNPSYIVDPDPAAPPVWPDSDPNIKSLDAQPYNPGCYSKTLLTSGPPPADRFFYLGGPGGDAPGCQYQ
jgi:hypothetical protein